MASLRTQRRSQPNGAKPHATARNLRTSIPHSADSPHSPARSCWRSGAGATPRLPLFTHVCQLLTTTTLLLRSLVAVLSCVRASFRLYPFSLEPQVGLRNSTCSPSWCQSSEVSTATADAAAAVDQRSLLIHLSAVPWHVLARCRTTPPRHLLRRDRPTHFVSAWRCTVHLASATDWHELPTCLFTLLANSMAVLSCERRIVSTPLRSDLEPVDEGNPVLLQHPEAVPAKAG